MSRQGALEDERGFTLVEVMIVIIHYGHSVRDSQLYLVRRGREPPGGLGDQPARRGPAAGAFQGDQQA